MTNWGHSRPRIVGHKSNENPHTNWYEISPKCPPIRLREKMTILAAANRLMGGAWLRGTSSHAFGFYTRRKSRGIRILRIYTGSRASTTNQTKERKDPTQAVLSCNCYVHLGPHVISPSIISLCTAWKNTGQTLKQNLSSSQGKFEKKKGSKSIRSTRQEFETIDF